MRYLTIMILLASCTSKTEVACNCDEVMDKRVVSHEYPYLYWDYQLYVQHCQGALQWVNVDSDKYANTNRGDCY